MKIWDSRGKKIVVSILVIIILYAGAGFLLLPMLTKKYLPGKTSELLNMEVTIQDAACNPFLLSASLEGVDIKDKDDQTSCFKSDKLFIRVCPTTIIRFIPVLAEIRVENPVLAIVRDADGALNCIPPVQSDETESQDEKESSGQVPGFILKTVSVIDGIIRFEDQMVGGSHQISRLNFLLPYLSSQQDKLEETADMTLKFLLNGSDVQINLSASPFASEPEFNTRIATGDIDLIKYLSYASLPAGVNIKTLEANTTLDTSLKVTKEDLAFIIEGEVNLLNASVLNQSEQEVLGFSKLGVKILPSDVLKLGINLDQIQLNSPRATVIRHADQSINLNNMFAGSRQSADTTREEMTAVDEDKSAQVNIKKNGTEKPDKNNGLKLKLNQLVLDDGKIGFKDETCTLPFETKINDLNFKVKDLAFDNILTAACELSFETDTHEKIKIQSDVISQPLSLKGNLVVNDLTMDRYDPYLAGFNAKMEDGKMSLTTAFDIRKEDEDIKGTVSLNDIAVNSFQMVDRDTNETMISFPVFSVKNGQADIGEKIINTGDIKIDSGSVLIQRSKGGTLNLVHAFNSGDSTRQKNNITDNDKQTVEKNSWDVELSSFSTSQMTIRFKDLTPQDPVDIVLSKINSKLSSLSTRDPKEGLISLHTNWNDSGKIEIKGSCTLAGKKAGVDVQVDQIDIKSVQPYFTESVRVMVTDGKFKTRGKLNLDWNNAEQPSVQFAGQSSINRFICLDKETAKDFFKADSFFMSGLNASVFPVKVSVKKISLTDFYSNIMIHENGTSNLQTIFKEPTSPEKEADKKEPVDVSVDVSGDEKQPAAVPEIKIESITLQGGEIQFADFFTKPNFKAGMKALAGSVSGLSSEQTSRADLHLKGIHGQSSPLDISGIINPLAPKKFFDIDISFKDIELTNFTPYAAKYLGYEIEKGKLILDLEYRVDGNKLESENRVRFDNFALGSRIESKDATSLPIGLAISLLKNKDDQINLDLPVSGQLDDPEFSVGGIVVKMIGNLIIKVVTSPFAVIGAMFGGGEDLEYLEYQPGITLLSSSHEEKLEKLKQILTSKPTIRLEIQGMHQPELEEDALMNVGFNDLIKAEKFKLMVASGAAVKTLNDVQISDEEIPIFVNLAYTKAGFPKPRNQDGTEKQISLDDKIKLLQTSIPVKQEDYRQLSMKRSENVKAALILDGNIEKERIFILEPQTYADKEKKSRVKFSLK